MNQNTGSDIPLETVNRIKKSFCEALSKSFTEEEFSILKFKDTREWDSISHIRLMSILREEFSIKFSFEEMVKMTTFQEVKRIITEHREKSD